jgi:hypothetical protein
MLISDACKVNVCVYEVSKFLVPYLWHYVRFDYPLVNTNVTYAGLTIADHFEFNIRNVEWKEYGVKHGDRAT